MKNKITKYIIIFTLIINIFIYSCQSAEAIEENSTNSAVDISEELLELNQNNLEDNSKIVKELEAKNIFFLSGDTSLQGVFAGDTFYFKKNEYWELGNNNYIELYFDKTGIETYLYSTMTIYLNDKPIKSILLSDYEENGNVITIRLPNSYIQNNYNSISFRLYHRISDIVCDDRVNVGNWVVLKSNSFLHLEYLYKDDEIGLKEFPYPYLLFDNDNVINCIIGLPDKPTNNEIEAALGLSGLFSELTKFSTSSINILSFSDIIQKNYKGNVILISEDNVFPNGEKILEYNNKTGMLFETINSEDTNSKALLISGDLKKAIDVLKDTKITKQMISENQQIDFSINIDNPKDNEHNSFTITLDELGYNSTILSGAFYQTAQFYFDTPVGWDYNKEAFFNINFKYAEILNFSRSSVTVYIDNVPIKSKKLLIENANNDTLSISIPKEVLWKDGFNITIKFYLEIEDFNCELNSGEQIWAMIDNASCFEIPYKIQEKVVFDYYPSPFVRGNSLQDLAFIIDSFDNFHEINICSDIFSTLSKFVDTRGEIKVSTSLNEDLQDTNLIIIGDSKGDNIRGINDNLYFKLNNDFTNFLTDENIKVVDDPQSSLVSLQLIKSPLNSEKTALVLLSTNSSYLEYGRILLSNRALFNGLVGDVVVADSTGVIYEVYYDKNNIPKDKNATLEGQNQNKSSLDEKTKFVIFSISIILFLIIITFIIILREIKRKK